MEYSISETAKKAGITASTIRFYEKEGLLPSIKRDKNGIRSFTDEELANFLAVTIGTSVVAANMASGNTIDKEDYDNYINELKNGYLKQLKRELQNET